MGQAQLAEERGQHRRRVLKGATILNGITSSETKCIIRNMHEEGAELRVDADARVPNEFLLYVPVDGIAYQAVVRWRRTNAVGVMFTGRAEKPHWHYG